MVPARAHVPWSLGLCDALVSPAPHRVQRETVQTFSSMQRWQPVSGAAPSSVLSTLQTSSPRLPPRSLFRAHARADLVASRLEHRRQIVRPVVNRLVAYTCACAKHMRNGILRGHALWCAYAGHALDTIVLGAGANYKMHHRRVLHDDGNAC